MHGRRVYGHALNIQVVVHLCLYIFTFIRSFFFCSFPLKKKFKLHVSSYSGQKMHLPDRGGMKAVVGVHPAEAEDL